MWKYLLCLWIMCISLCINGQLAMNILADCKRVINRQFVPKKRKGSFIHKKDRKMHGFSAQTMENP